LFDREAIRAILKWKFKPRVVDGEAVERRATQTIDFKLENA
jgi:protein TonB